MIPLGTALQTLGAAALIAGLVVGWMGSYGPERIETFSEGA